MKDLWAVFSFNILKILKTKLVMIALPVIFVTSFILNFVFAMAIKNTIGLSITYVFTIIFAIIILVLLNITSIGTGFVNDQATGIQGLMIRRGVKKGSILYSKVLANKVITLTYIVLTFLMYLTFLNTAKPMGYEILLDGFIYGIFALIPLDILFSGFVVLVATLSFKLKAILPLGVITGVFSCLYWIFGPLMLLISSNYQTSDAITIYNQMQVVDMENSVKKSDKNLITDLRADYQKFNKFFAKLKDKSLAIFSFKIDPTSEFAKTYLNNYEESFPEPEKTPLYFTMDIQNIFDWNSDSSVVKYEPEIMFANKILQGREETLRWLKEDYFSNFDLYKEDGVEVIVSKSKDESGRNAFDIAQEALTDNLYLKFINAIIFKSDNVNERTQNFNESWYSAKTEVANTGTKQLQSIIANIDTDTSEDLKTIFSDYPKQVNEVLELFKNIIDKEFNFAIKMENSFGSSSSSSGSSNGRELKVYYDENDSKSIWIDSDVREKINAVDYGFKSNAGLVIKSTDVLASGEYVGLLFSKLFELPAATRAQGIDIIDGWQAQVKFNPIIYFFEMTILSGRDDFYYDTIGSQMSLMPFVNTRMPIVVDALGNQKDENNNPIAPLATNLTMRTNDRALNITAAYLGFIFLGLVFLALAYLPYRVNVYKKGVE